MVGGIIVIGVDGGSCVGTVDGLDRVCVGPGFGVDALWPQPGAGSRKISITNKSIRRNGRFDIFSVWLIS